MHTVQATPTLVDNLRGYLPVRVAGGQEHSSIADPITWHEGRCVFCGRHAGTLMRFVFMGEDGSQLVAGACDVGCYVVVDAVASAFTGDHRHRLVTVR